MMRCLNCLIFFLLNAAVLLSAEQVMNIKLSEDLIDHISKRIYFIN